MSESEKKPRTMQEIQGEFHNLCAKAGHLQYQINVYEKDLSVLNNTIRDLNLEAAAIQAKQPEAPKAEEGASS